MIATSYGNLSVGVRPPLDEDKYVGNEIPATNNELLNTETIKVKC